MSKIINYTEVEQFKKDGAVLIKGKFDNVWIEKLKLRSRFSEFDGLKMLESFGISVARFELIENKCELLRAVDKLSYPLVLKTADLGFEIEEKSKYGLG